MSIEYDEGFRTGQNDKGFTVRCLEELYMRHAKYLKEDAARIKELEELVQEYKEEEEDRNHGLWQKGSLWGE